MSMVYNVSCLLMGLLKPLVGKTEYFVKNTASFSKDLKSIKLDEDEIMNSHDVVSLFTNVSITLTLEVISQRLRLDNSLEKCTKLLADDIVELLEFVLDMTYFSYGGEIYRQIHGMPMGSPVSVVNMLMEDNEETSIAKAPPHMKQKIWRRYVSDSFEIIIQDQRERFTAHLSPSHIYTYDQLW